MAHKKLTCQKTPKTAIQPENKHLLSRIDIFNPNPEVGLVAQTSQSAVSRVSYPADGERICEREPSRGQPTGKSAIQQVGKPAPRLKGNSDS